jgi:5-hydroxyisourate hydrolase
MGRLSTHVLDTTAGLPGAGMTIELERLHDGRWQPLKTVSANADGRTDRPLLEGDALLAGRYRLRFHVANYFTARGFSLPDPPFLDVVPIEIGISDTTGHYHVPLLCTPWTYSTYRGS